MKIKRYVVKEMQEAIRLIKQDLGPEAIIVSSYKVPAKGLFGLFAPRLLEVTAAVDENPEINLSMNCPPAQVALNAGSGLEKQIGPVGLSAGALPAGGQADRSRDRELYLSGGKCIKKEEGLPAGLQQWPFDKDEENRQGGEESSLFDMIYQKQIEADLNGDPILKWRKTLLNMDVQENIVEHLLSVLKKGPGLAAENNEHIYMNLLRQMTELLEPAYRSKDPAGVLAFIGPPGVGKTTTLAKLATRFALYDHKKVALVAVYAYRIGAVEQLQAYGDFLGVPVDVVMTPAELSKVLESHSDKDYILIDTAGRPARSAGQVLELKGFLDVVKEPRDIFLVLNCANKNRDLMKTAYEFDKIPYSKLIFTRIDETDTYGSILNLICATGKPVTYLADGQDIPDDISEAGPKKIARLLLGGVEPNADMAT